VPRIGDAVVPCWIFPTYRVALAVSAAGRSGRRLAGRPDPPGADDGPPGWLDRTSV